MGQLQVLDEHQSKARAKEMQVDSNQQVNQAQQQQVEAGETSWARLVQKPNKGFKKGMNLNFIALIIKEGETIARLQQKELDKMKKIWDNTVIMYVVGSVPSIESLKKFISLAWPSIVQPAVYYHNDGFFLVRLKSEGDFNEVINTIPLAMGKRPVIVKEWREDFEFKKEILRNVPVWVRLPKLPLKCWSPDSLSRIGSTLGVPVCTDEFTTTQERVSYARMLVEIDVTGEMKQEILIEEPDGKLTKQAVIYEWVPDFCPKCQKIGHTCHQKNQEQAPVKEGARLTWVPKKTPQIQNVTPQPPVMDTNRDREEEFRPPPKKKIAKCNISRQNTPAQKSPVSLFHNLEVVEEDTGQEIVEDGAGDLIT